MFKYMAIFRIIFLSRKKNVKWNVLIQFEFSHNIFEFYPNFEFEFSDIIYEFYQNLILNFVQIFQS